MVYRNTHRNKGCVKLKLFTIQCIVLEVFGLFVFQSELHPVKLMTSHNALHGIRVQLGNTQNTLWSL